MFYFISLIVLIRQIYGIYSIVGTHTFVFFGQRKGGVILRYQHKHSTDYGNICGQDLRCSGWCGTWRDRRIAGVSICTRPDRSQRSIFTLISYLCRDAAATNIKMLTGRRWEMPSRAAFQSNKEDSFLLFYGRISDMKLTQLPPKFPPISTAKK